MQNPLQWVTHLPKGSARLQDYENRQNSIEIESDPSLVDNQKHLDLIAEWNRRQQGVIETSRKTYEWAIENGIAKEQISCSFYQKD